MEDAPTRLSFASDDRYDLVEKISRRGMTDVLPATSLKLRRAVPFNVFPIEKALSITEPEGDPIGERGFVFTAAVRELQTRRGKGDERIQGEDRSDHRGRRCIGQAGLLVL